MKRILLIACLLAAAACSVNEERIVAPREEKETTEQENTTVSAIIEVDENFAAGLEAATKSGESPLEGLGAVHYERVFPYAGEFEERTRKAGLHLFYKVVFDEGVTRTKAGEMLVAADGIVNAEFPRKIKKRSAIPDDPYFKWQWDLYNDMSLKLDCTQSSSRYGITKFTNKGADMNLLDVWDKYTVGSSDVIVSVVDGGVDLKHPDLAANCIPAGFEGSKDFVKNGYTILADSHGTHVAGTIAAVRNNGIGVAGIAGGDYANGIPGVKILSCQIFTDDDGASDINTAAAIKWGADHGALICQNSWGYYADENEDGEVSAKELAEFKKETIPSFLSEAIDYFIKYAGCDNNVTQLPGSLMKGGIVCFAAGNEAIDYDPICAYEPVLAVGAGTAGYTRAYYSNYGSWVDICAPGGDGLYSGFGPEYDEQEYSRGQIFNLYATRKTDDYDYTDYGYMSGTSMACPHVSGALALIISYLGGPGFTNTECKRLLLEGANSSHTSSSQYVGPWVDVTASIELGATHSDIAPDKVSDYTLSAVRKTVDVAWKVPADKDDAKAFGVRILYGSDETALRASSPGSIKSGVISRDVKVGSNAAGTTMNLNIDGMQYSTDYFFVLYAYDRSGNYSEASELKKVRTPDNHAPAVRQEPEGILLYGTGSGETVSVASLFTDQDGDELSFECTSKDAGDVISLNFDGRSAKITARKGGAAELRITASDGDKSTGIVIPVLVKGDLSDLAETYPNPVTTDLVIRTEKSAETYVRIVNSTGKTVYEKTSEFSGFDPLIVNMTGLAPGRYSVTIRYGGNTYHKTIVKV